MRIFILAEFIDKIEIRKTLLLCNKSGTHDLAQTETEPSTSPGLYLFYWNDKTFFFIDTDAAGKTHDEAEKTLLSDVQQMVQESDVTTEKEVGTNLVLGEANDLHQEEQTRDDIANTNGGNVCNNKSETNGFQQEDFENYGKDDQLNTSKKSSPNSQCKMINEDQTYVHYFKCPSLNCNLSFENFTSLKLHAQTNHNRRLNATHMRPYQVKKVHSVKSTHRREENKLIHNHKWHSSHACSLCGRMFLTKEKRDHHEANHSKMKFKCSCGYLFFGVTRL